MVTRVDAMNTLFRRTPGRVVAGVLTVLVALMGTAVNPAIASHSQPAPAEDLLILPVVNNAGDSYASTASAFTATIKAKVNAIGTYHALSYSVLAPSIQRAYTVENTVSRDELTAPAATPDRARKIAQIEDEPAFFVGSLDSITVDATSGTATVKATGALYSTDTGNAIQQGSVTGVAAPVSLSEDAPSVLTRALDNAAGQLVSQIGAGFNAKNKGYRSTGAIGAVHKSRFNPAAILLLALTVGLAIAISNNHGSSHSSSSNSSSTTTTTPPSGPPAPPAE